MFSKCHKKGSNVRCLQLYRLGPMYDMIKHLKLKLANVNNTGMHLGHVFA